MPSTIEAADDDYAVVRRAIAFMSQHWRAQPDVEAIAHACGVTPDQMHHLFRRWAGLSPKEFVAALTLDHARKLLARFRERSRCRVRGRPVGTRTAA